MLEFGLRQFEVVGVVKRGHLHRDQIQHRFVIGIGRCLMHSGGHFGCGSGRRREGSRGLGRYVGVAELVEPRPDPFERGAQGRAGIGRRYLLAARFDGTHLGIEQVADPAIRADLPPPPGDFLDDAGTFADRRQFFRKAEAVQCRRDARSGLIDCAANRRQRFLKAIVSCWLRPLRQRFLDPRHRIQHHAGIGVAVALGKLAEEPAAPRRLHEGFADRVIIRLARQRRASGNRR